MDFENIKIILEANGWTNILFVGGNNNGLIIVTEGEQRTEMSYARYLELLTKYVLDRR
ncbi:hypothetical protein [Flavobacterium alkalisoli]|uniref:hypothetical protein n=1 Tax=Flavobacterium alkalisoli TaxID=2602769 RepID=UPI00143D28D8|nr:hypothetical protein [Flavobacterium alkalisoli]